MSSAPGVLIGLGTVLVIIGCYFIYVTLSRAKPNEEYEWFGFGKHPFRK